MYKKLCYILASCFGVGYSPFAPGTAGSLVTLPLAFVMAYYLGTWGLIGASALIFFVGVMVSKEVLNYTTHDPSLIVIDEVVGQLLAFSLIGAQLKGNSHAWGAYLIGFLLFRLFDIWKPQPVRWADRKILSAWGVMLDDVFAGMYAAVVLFIINLFTKIL